MNKVVFEYEHSQHILEVDGIGYEIPSRTAALEKELKEHDAKVGAMSEYEGNMALLGILFGKANAKKMFPEGEKTNLDKLARCVDVAISLFMMEYTSIQQESANKKMKQVAPYMNALSDIGELASELKKNKNLKAIPKRK